MEHDTREMQVRRRRTHGMDAMPLGSSDVAAISKMSWQAHAAERYDSHALSRVRWTPDDVGNWAQTLSCWSLLVPTIASLAYMHEHCPCTQVRM